MDTEIELHDSELLKVDIEAGTLLIDAYVHRSGVDVRREGGYQHTLFRFENLRMESDKSALSGDIYDWTIFASNLNQKRSDSTSVQDCKPGKDEDHFQRGWS